MVSSIPLGGVLSDYHRFTVDTRWSVEGEAEFSSDSTMVE